MQSERRGWRKCKVSKVEEGGVAVEGVVVVVAEEEEAEDTMADAVDEGVMSVAMITVLPTEIMHHLVVLALRLHLHGLLQSWVVKQSCHHAQPVQVLAAVGQ